MALGVLGALALAAAGEVAAADGPLTERQAVELALRADAQLSALAHRVEERQALRDVATLENPELRVQNLRSDQLFGGAGADSGLDGARVGLRWRPPGLGQSGARQAEAEAGAARAAAELALQRRALVARVRGLHARALGLDAQLEVARAAQAECERLRQLVGQRVEQGGATVMQESAAELDRLDGAATVQRLEGERRRVREDLAAELDLPADAALRLSGEGGARCAPPAAAPAPAAHPLQAALQAEARAADADLSRRQLDLWPWFSYVQASYVLVDHNDPGYWALQFGLTLPLLDWKGGERRALESARLRLADEQRALAGAEQRQLRRALAEAADQAAAAEHHRQATAVLEEGIARFRRHGAEVGAMEVAELRTRQLAARLAQLQAELRCALAGIEADQLTGAGG